MRVALDTSRPDRDYALLQVDAAGVHRWVFPTDQQADGKVEFVLPPSSAPLADETRTDRGPIVGAMKIGARIISWATAGITGKLARQIAGDWENRRRPYFLKQLAFDGTERDPDWDFLSSGRALLLVHGTFSTPTAGFDGLFKSEEFRRILSHYENRCLAFAHPSMSEGIEDNIVRFKECVPQGVRLDFDIICHSRGGLVARALTADAASGQLPLRVGRLVMVAAPNRGTPLVDSHHWVDFIDRHTNLLVDLPDGVSTIFLEGVLCLVKIIGSGAVEGLPGLAAMDAKGEELISQRELDLGTTELYALVADFSPAAEPRMAALIKKAGDAAVDSFFGEANDIVVPTNGCFDLKDAKGFPLPSERVHQFSDGTVNHVNFFNSARVRSTLEELLTAPA
jgi:pimeloyl-ACP methyl ester carboxylesterase